MALTIKEHAESGAVNIDEVTELRARCFIAESDSPAADQAMTYAGVIDSLLNGNSPVRLPKMQEPWSSFQPGLVNRANTEIKDDRTHGHPSGKTPVDSIKVVAYRVERLTPTFSGHVSFKVYVHYSNRVTAWSTIPDLHVSTRNARQFLDIDATDNLKRQAIGTDCILASYDQWCDVSGGLPQGETSPIGESMVFAGEGADVPVPVQTVTLERYIALGDTSPVGMFPILGWGEFAGSTNAFEYGPINRRDAWLFMGIRARPVTWGIARVIAKFLVSPCLHRVGGIRYEEGTNGINPRVRFVGGKPVASGRSYRVMPSRDWSPLIQFYYNDIVDAGTALVINPLLECTDLPG